ncbi:MAG: hypothetical protein P8Y01_09555 [Woeseiaceae bacterium]
MARHIVEAEHDKTAENQYPWAVAEFRDRGMQGRVDRAGLAQDFDDAADDEDQENDVLRIGKALGHADQEVPRGQGDLVRRRHLLVGSRDDHHAVRVVRKRHAVERALRNDVGQQLRHDDEAEYQDQRVDIDAAFLHGAGLVVVADGRDYNKKGPAKGPFSLLSNVRPGQSRLMKSCRTYQNISAIEANRAIDAAT